MKEFFQAEKTEREAVIKTIADALERRDEVLFAYVHGSFLDAPSFRDVDVAVFAEPRVFADKDVFDLECSLAQDVRIPYPLDLRIMNGAPVAFQNNVGARGRLLFTKDEEFLTDFLERTSLIMVKDFYLIRESLQAFAS